MASQGRNHNAAPVAIVGMACRLSGDVSTLDEFWTLLSRSRDGWCSIPKDRFSHHAYYHPSPHKAGTLNIRGGYFMKRDLSKFDAPFFNITKQEAVAMDPQQRQLLEVTYEALENAGIAKESIAGRNMGVFVGGRASDYRVGTFRDVNQMPMFDATGNHPSIQAGRLSYYFDLHGPALTADTACSSGLYALHSAVQSIRSGESDSAIVAGCNLYLQPDDTISMSMLGIFNDQGRTFAFDHRATSGFARGEGVACLVLKPLDQAIRDNDRIRSVIVNTGTNQDGRTVGITTPSGEAQERLIRDVYSRAGISPEDVGFVEAHGTGTRVGDPIEAGALRRVFGAKRTKRQPLYIGSVKTNVGHLENASGIVSVIKAALMLEKGLILPNVNYEKNNPAIPMDQWHFKVPVNIRPWPRTKKYISVNNFGFGGSNAHVVLERPPVVGANDPDTMYGENPRLFVVSGHDEESARKVALQLGVYIEQHPEVFQRSLMRDMAYTLGNRRTHLPYRIALAATSLNELATGLNSIEAAPARASKPPKLAFVYTGQGAQWATMGVELLESYPVFSETIDAAKTALERLGANFDLVEELKRGKDESRIGASHISQPACTAVQLGLTELLKSWDINPSYVIGHSSGEIGAAYATGSIGLEDAMAVAYHRGRVVSGLKISHPDLKGGMLAVGAGASEAREVMSSLGLDGIAIACENSPQSVTVSGDEVAVDRFAAELESQGIFNRKLRVDIAYHSAHMQPVSDAYMSAIDRVHPITSETQHPQMYSSLLGKKLPSTSSLGPRYWVENLVKPVLFSSALRDMINDVQPDIIVEIGPHAALEGPIKQILKSVGGQAASTAKYLPSLVRNRLAATTTLKLAGGLFARGYSINFTSINEPDTALPTPALITDFAPYSWADHKYWFEPRSSKQHRLKPFPRHDLLGLLDDTCSETEPTWRNVLSVDNVPWLRDHRMQSLTVFPLAGYMCAAVEAANQRARLRGTMAEHITGYRLREVQVSKALIMDEGASYETMVSLRPYAEGTRSYSDHWDEFRFASWTSSRGWIEHCRCLVSIKRAQPGNPVTSWQSGEAKSRLLQAQGINEAISLEDFYTELEARGAGYGPLFRMQASSNLRSSGEYSIGKVPVLDTASAMPQEYETSSIVPAPFLDLFFQLTYPILGAGMNNMPCLFMPSAIKEVDIEAEVPNATGEEAQVVVHGSPALPSLDPVDFSIDAWHPACPDQPVVKFAGFRMTPVNDGADERPLPRPLCYDIKWEPIKVRSEAPSSTASVSDDLEKVGEQVKSEWVVLRTPRVKYDLEKTSSASDEEMSTGTPNEEHSSLLDAPFVIVSDEDESNDLVRELCILLGKKTGVKPLIRTFDNVEIDAQPYIVLTEMHRNLLDGMNQQTFERLQKLLLTSSSVFWVTSGAYRLADNPKSNIAQGVFRTLRSELGKVAATLDLDPHSRLGGSERAELILTALNASLTRHEDGSPVDFEFAEEDGHLVVPRVSNQEALNLQVHRETQDAEPYLQPFEQHNRRLKMAVGTYGALDSLYWKDEPDSPLGDNEIEIKVSATGMNFKDVVVAMGQVSQPYVGVECAGTVARIGSHVTDMKVGDRVCSMSLGAYGTYARCLSSSASVIPDSMDFTTAASIPVVYSTAYYGMVEVAKLQPGERILIHAAAGGVGQAAIQLAQMLGGDIFVTVGGPEKKLLLMDTYGIPEDRIFHSRNTSFGSAVREATGGEGVDVVLNSLAGELLRETWECLAPFGRFIEIGKRDVTSNTRLEMAKFEYNCSFSSVDLTLVAAQRPKVMRRVLTAVMDLLARRAVHPISPITSFSIGEVETAMRKLQSGKTTGKVVINHDGADNVKVTHPTPSSTALSGNATYIIIGGTGGLGRSMAKRMVQRGARNIVLSSRSGKKSDALRALIEECKANGASIHVQACDAGEESSARDLIASLKKELPPIRGIVHAAMVLKDVLFEKMSFEDYDTVVRSKVAGGWNFHNALLDTPLDFFIVLSSIAGIVGNRGQAAYAGANTFLDALVRHRRRRGLKATSLNLTAVEDAGYLAGDSGKASVVLKTLAGGSMREVEALALLDAAMSGQVGRLCGEQCLTGLDFGDGSNLPYFSSDGKFSYLREAALAKLLDSASAAASSSRSISQELKHASTASEAAAIVTGGLRDKFGAIMMLPEEVTATYGATTSVTALGLDSLNAIELRNWIGKELQSHLQLLEILTSETLGDLAAHVLKKTKLGGDWTRTK